MKLILIRHGWTEANEKRLYCGRTDLPLSESGKKELEGLKEQGICPDPAGFRILISPKKRCRETLAILYGNVPYETDEALCEMDLGAFEMHSYEELKEDPAYIAWITGWNEANPTPGGESGLQMQVRVEAALERILQDGRDTLTVTHGGVIAVIMDALFGAEEKNRYEWQPENGRGYLIDTEAHSYERF